MHARRRLLLAMASAGLMPARALAQAQKKSVVVLFAGEEDDDDAAMRPFFEEMERLGWSDGGNVAYDKFYGRGTREYMEGLARSAASATPDLIYATTSALALASMKASDSVPIVFTSFSDPVATGLVDSLTHPGRNATGAFSSTADGVRRRLELARQLSSGARRLAVLLDRRATDFSRQRELHQVAARALRADVALVEFTNFEAVAKLLAQLRRDGVTTVVLTPSVTLLARRREVSDTALRNRVALIAHRIEWAEAGALVSYGAEVADALKRTARIADSVLNGASPADTPVQIANKFELAVNQRVAKALGVSLAPDLLKRADRVFD